MSEAETLRWTVFYHDGFRWVGFAFFRGSRCDTPEAAVDFAMHSAPVAPRGKPLKVHQYIRGDFSASVTHHAPRQAVAA